MIRRLYFLYAMYKGKVLILSPYFIFVLTKRCERSVHCGFPSTKEHRYEILFRSRQDIGSTIEKYM